MTAFLTPVEDHIILACLLPDPPNRLMQEHSLQSSLIHLARLEHTVSMLTRPALILKDAFLAL